MTTAARLAIAMKVITLFRALFRRAPWPSLDEELAAAIRPHGLGPFAYAEAMRQGVDARVLRRDWVSSARLSALRTYPELEGIEALRWKGADYARSLYADPAERPMADVDLLVREKDFVHARSQLEAAGFRHALVQRGVAAHPKHYAAQLMRGDEHVDLHRGIRQSVRATIDYDAVFARASGDCLDPLDRLVFHAAHVAAHELIVPLLAFVDLELLLGRTPLSRPLWERAREHGLVRPLRATLAARARLFGWPSPPTLQASPREIVRLARPPRALQLVRKAVLFDSARALWQFALYSIAAPRRMPARRI